MSALLLNPETYWYIALIVVCYCASIIGALRNNEYSDNSFTVLIIFSTMICVLPVYDIVKNSANGFNISLIHCLVMALGLSMLAASLFLLGYVDKRHMIALEERLKNNS